METLVELESIKYDDEAIIIPVMKPTDNTVYYQWVCSRACISHGQ